MERDLKNHQLRNYGAWSIRYSFVPLRPQVSPEEKDRGEQWKGFAGEIRHEVRNLAAKQKLMEEKTAARLSHIEETSTAIAAQQKLLQETSTAIAAQQKIMEETTAARLSRIEAQLERLLEANLKTALPEGSRDEFA